MKKRLIKITVTDKDGVVLDQFMVRDLSIMPARGDETEVEEYIGRPMCNVSLIERLQHLCTY